MDATDLDLVLHDAMVQGAVRTIGAMLFVFALLALVVSMKAPTLSRKLLFAFLSLLLCFASCTVDAAAPLLPVG